MLVGEFDGYSSVLAVIMRIIKFVIFRNFLNGTVCQLFKWGFPAVNFILSGGFNLK